MKTQKASKKSRAILKAIAEGMSFEQILGRYPTLNYHDIFRAAAEASTSSRGDMLARAGATGWLACAWAIKDGLCSQGSRRIPQGNGIEFG